jgi:hypothetical protein
MQLRVARLCLDCEELHDDNRCPRCASEHYAFLSSWLPVDERRRWRRPAQAVRPGPPEVHTFVQTLLRWFRGGVSQPTSPATRRSDAVPDMNFGDAPSEPASPSRIVEDSTVP